MWKRLNLLRDEKIYVGMSIKARKVDPNEGVYFLFGYNFEMIERFGNMEGIIVSINRNMIVPSFDINQEFIWSKDMFLYKERKTVYKTLDEVSV
jgi:hypothetical protein